MSNVKNIASYIAFGIGILAIAGVTIAIIATRRKPVKCNSNFLFVGDSNTVISHSYATQLQKYCPDAKITVLAQSGRNTTTMLQTLTTELNGGNKYDVIAILGGSNDLYAPDTVKKNLDAMYKLAKASGAKVVAVTPPSKNFIHIGQPTWGGNDYQKLLNNLASITAWIKSQSQPDVIVDWNKITNNKEAFAGTDYQHANATAHAELLNKIIKELPIKST